MPATEAPFYGDGSLASYPSEYGYNPTKMMPIVPFMAELKLVDYTKGRSAVNFIFGDVNSDRTYPMFLKDFFKLVMYGPYANGKPVNRRWTVIKRGQNYGITPAS